MSKSLAILLLILTIVPLVFFLVFLAITFAVPLEEQVKGDTFNSPALIRFQFLFLVWTVILGLYYLFRVASNNVISQERKLLWAIFMLAGGHVAMIAYWYNYFWPKESKA